jgi:hypothetical protein
MTKTSNTKRNVMIGAGILVVLAMGAGGYYLYSSPDEKNLTLEEQLEQSASSHLFAFADNGVVKLYRTKDGALLDTFDLKTLSTGKKVIAKTPTPPVKAPVRSVPEQKTFKDFIQVPITIKKGDTVWDIQESLTPEQNINTMLSYLKEINKGQKLHPVYPGEKRIFLKEKDNAHSETEEATSPAPVTETTNQTVQNMNGETMYLYSKSEDFKTLYAYNDAEKSFYRVSVKDKKIEAKPLITIETLQGVKDFKVIKDTLYVVWNNGLNLKEIPLSNPQQMKDFSLKGNVDIWAIHNGYFFYTYKDKLGKLNLKDNTQTDILLGDKSLDYVFTKDKLYILNKFGSKLDNSILIKVNPSDLKVDDLVELKTNENAILSEEKDTETILVGQMTKLTDLNRNVKKTPVILPIHASNLQKERFVKNIPFDKNALELDGYVYVLKDGKVLIYSSVSGNLIKEIRVEDATKFMPLK